MTVDNEFLEASIDLYRGSCSGKIAAFQYGRHAGVRQIDGKSMSGDMLWGEVEEHRKADGLNSEYNFVTAESRINDMAVSEVGNFLPPGTRLLAFGVGTFTAFKRNDWRYIEALKSREAVLID